MAYLNNSNATGSYPTLSTPSGESDTYLTQISVGSRWGTKIHVPSLTDGTCADSQVALSARRLASELREASVSITTPPSVIAVSLVLPQRLCPRSPHIQHKPMNMTSCHVRDNTDS